VFTALRNKFGIPGVIAVIALVFAMLGGAYAAQSSDSGNATASAKAKKGPRGPRGPKGATGAAGPVGPAGAAGAKGDAGAAGAAGEKGATGPTGPTGATGKDGTSVSVTKINVGTAKCNELGGASVEKVGEPASAVEVCNGKEGKDGEPGDPWTPESKLPVNATETGGWAFFASDDDPTILAPISFPIQLGSELSSENVHFQNLPTKDDFKAICPGSVTLPTAPSGHLCIYYNTFGGAPFNATFSRVTPLHNLEEQFEPTEPGTNKSGAVIQFTYSGGAGETAFGAGSFAVTG